MHVVEFNQILIFNFFVRSFSRLHIKNAENGMLWVVESANMNANFVTQIACHIFLYLFFNKFNLNFTCINGVTNIVCTRCMRMREHFFVGY